AHPARLARRQDDPLELPLHSVDFRGRLPHRCELLRPFEDAGTYAEREIVTLAGATFANNLRDDRDRNFLGRLAADRDAKRRMHVAEPLDRNPALADSLERGLHRRREPIIPTNPHGCISAARTTSSSKE